MKREWSWSKGAIRFNDGDGWRVLFDFEDFWNEYGEEATEAMAEFIVDALNAAEQRAAPFAGLLDAMGRKTFGAQWPQVKVAVGRRRRQPFTQEYAGDVERWRPPA